jgi:aminoglycoside phosphotransferase family enzyme
MGKPIDIKLLNDSKTDQEWAQLIKEFVYQIKNNVNFDFKDYIKR